MTIGERFKVMNEQDAVYIGDIVTQFKQTEAYDVLKCVTETEIMSELALDNSKLNSERQLGRLEGIRRILLDLDNFEVQRDALVAGAKEKAKADRAEEVEGATVPTPKLTNAGSV